MPQKRQLAAAVEMEAPFTPAQHNRCRGGTLTATNGADDGGDVAGETVRESEAGVNSAELGVTISGPERRQAALGAAVMPMPRHNARGQRESEGRGLPQLARRHVPSARRTTSATAPSEEQGENDDQGPRETANVTTDPTQRSTQRLAAWIHACGAALADKLHGPGGPTEHEGTTEFTEEPEWGTHQRCDINTRLDGGFARPRV